MSIDFQVISFRHSATISSIETRSLSPLSINIYGPSFRSVEEVLINDVGSEFVVFSEKHIAARVPNSIDYQGITSVVVYETSAADSMEEDASAKLDLYSGQNVEGFTKLVQNFVTLLLTTPGTSIFHSYGGGLLDIVGRTNDSGLRAAASVAINNTSSQLVQIQSSVTNLSMSERLKSVGLKSMQFDRNSATLYMTLSLKSMDGSSGVVGISPSSV